MKIQISLHVNTCSHSLNRMTSEHSLAVLEINFFTGSKSLLLGIKSGSKI